MDYRVQCSDNIDGESEHPRVKQNLTCTLPAYLDANLYACCTVNPAGVDLTSVYVASTAALEAAYQGHLSSE